MDIYKTSLNKWHILVEYVEVDGITNIVIKKELLDRFETELRSGWTLDDVFKSISQIASSLESQFRNNIQPSLDKLKANPGCVAYDAPGLGNNNDVHFIGSSPTGDFIISDYYTDHKSYDKAINKKQGVTAPGRSEPGDLVVDISEIDPLTKEAIFQAIKQTLRPLDNLISLNKALNSKEISNSVESKVTVLFNDTNEIKEMTLEEFSSFLEERINEGLGLEGIEADLRIVSYPESDSESLVDLPIDFSDPDWEKSLVKKAEAFVATGQANEGILDGACKKKGIDLSDINTNDIAGLRDAHVRRFPLARRSSYDKSTMGVENKGA